MIIKRRFIVAVALWMGAASGLFAQTIEKGVLGKGTDWQTPYQVIDSQKDGPTVLIVGGVHGNEPAGWLAAEQIKSWKINRGKLIVLAQANRLGLKAGTRWFPPTRNDKSLRDLNRNFPTKSRSEPVTEIAKAIWSFVERNRPDYFFDLHEGFDFHRLNSKSVGSSVISFPANKDLAKEILDDVNKSISKEKQFDLLAGSGPVNGSLARACGEHLNAKSFILETTFKDQPISTRTRQHRQMVSFALQKIGMIVGSRVNDVVQNTKQKIEVGLFDGPGANARRILPVLRSFDDLYVVNLGPVDVNRVDLGKFDVLLFPGGSGSKQGVSIGIEGRGKIQQFVKNKGGVVGICAGAYLCSSHYNWSLNLMNAKVFNINVSVPGKGKKSMWFRGPAADVKVDIHATGRPFLGLDGLHTIRYQNGPIISPDNKPNVPEYRVLATFRTENGIYEAQKGTMIGKPAVLYSELGHGKVLAISPHFEFTKGKESVVHNAIQAVAR